MSRARQKIDAFLELPPQERRALIESAAAMPLVQVSLGLIGFKRTFGVLSRGAELFGRPAETFSMEQARRLARLVGAASRYGLVEGSCLSRSLTLWWLLRTRRIDGRLCVGVRPGDRGPESHAWIELDGVPINDSLDVRARFSAFERLTDRFANQPP